MNIRHLRLKSLSVWSDVITLTFHGASSTLSSPRKGRTSSAWAQDVCRELGNHGVGAFDAAAIAHAILDSDTLPIATDPARGLACVQAMPTLGVLRYTVLDTRSMGILYRCGASLRDWAADAVRWGARAGLSIEDRMLLRDAILQCNDPMEACV